jgi:hypothetical protein
MSDTKSGLRDEVSELPESDSRFPHELAPLVGNPKADVALYPSRGPVALAVHEPQQRSRHAGQSAFAGEHRRDSAKLGPL